MRKLKLAFGLRPFTKAERRRIARDNQRSLFPNVVYQRFEATLKALELSRHTLEQQREDVSGKSVLPFGGA